MTILAVVLLGLLVAEVAAGLWLVWRVEQRLYNLIAAEQHKIEQRRSQAQAFGTKEGRQLLRERLQRRLGES